MTERKFDIAILGGGPGGYTAAIRAAQLGFSVGLVEKGHLGGICLNAGCISTKALIQSASLYEQARNSKSFGVSIPEATFDWSRIQKYKDRCVIKLRKGVESLMKKNKIEVISGHGRLDGVDTIDVDGTNVRATHLILAPGSRSKALPPLPIDGERIITSDHALGLEELPKRMLVVGAGTIGCEFAYVMSTLGVEVTMVELLERALPMEDEEVSAEFESALKRRKIRLHTRCSVTGVDHGETGVTVQVKPIDGGEEFAVEVDKVLVSVGREAALDDCGLETIGVPILAGFIKTDGRMSTGVGNIRAIGDAVGGLMLAHKAAAEGILAIESIAGINPEPPVMANIPRATYAKPEVASVGLNENEARELYGDSVKVGRFPFVANGKAVVIGEREGFVKLIAAGENVKLIGAHAIGPHATDLIAVAVTAIGCGATAERFARIVQAHPTLCEAWPEAAHDVLHAAINF